jgi:hypothetical protein
VRGGEHAPLAALGLLLPAAPHAQVMLDIAVAVLTITIAATVIGQVRRFRRRQLIRQRMERLNGPGAEGATNGCQATERK